MWKYDEAKKAMEKLIHETNEGKIKWYHWGATDPSTKPDNTDGKIWLTIPNWTVYYTKLVGTHVTVEDGIGNQKFCIYWGPPVGNGGSIMDMEKELPLMAELLDTIRRSETEPLPKWKFEYNDENKGGWWMCQEHIWHTVRTTLDVYLNNTLEKPNEEEDKPCVVSGQYRLTSWYDEDLKKLGWQLGKGFWQDSFSEIGKFETLAECYKALADDIAEDEAKAKEWTEKLQK